MNNRGLEAKYGYLFKNFFKVININLNIAKIGAYIEGKYGIKLPMHSK